MGWSTERSPRRYIRRRASQRKKGKAGRGKTAGIDRRA